MTHQSTCTADRTDLDRVLTNRLINARDAVVDRARRAASGSADDGYQPAIHVSLRIVLGERAATAYAEINVADNGSGIPESARDRLFEPFFTTKSASRGTGLGLASARGIVQHLGGAIEFESHLDRGSTFRVRLSLAAETAAAPRISPSAVPTTDAAGTTVLLVDDEVALLDLAAIALRRAGVTVECVTTGGSAIEALLARPYDLAVVDVRLGGDIDGWDVMCEV